MNSSPESFAPIAPELTGAGSFLIAENESSHRLTIAARIFVQAGRGEDDERVIRRNALLGTPEMNKHRSTDFAQQRESVVNTEQSAEHSKAQQRWPGRLGADQIQSSAFQPGKLEEK